MAGQDYPAERIDLYVDALPSADMYALVQRQDLVRFAKAVIAVANYETDPVYRSDYTDGCLHAGADGLLLDDFEAVISTSDGSYGAAEEYRCRKCGAIGAQGVGPRSLLDLIACPTSAAPTPRRAPSHEHQHHSRHIHRALR